MPEDKVDRFFTVEHFENGKWKMYDRTYQTRKEAEVMLSEALIKTHRVVEFARVHCPGCGELSHEGVC